MASHHLQARQFGSPREDVNVRALELQELVNHDVLGSVEGAREGRRVEATREGGRVEVTREGRRDQASGDAWRPVSSTSLPMEEPAIRDSRMEDTSERQEGTGGRARRAVGTEGGDAGTG
jgi:hypothetical protein